MTWSPEWPEAEAVRCCPTTRQRQGLGMGNPLWENVHLQKWVRVWGVLLKREGCCGFFSDQSSMESVQTSGPWGKFTTMGNAFI